MNKSTEDIVDKILDSLIDKIVIKEFGKQKYSLLKSKCNDFYEEIKKFTLDQIIDTIDNTMAEVEEYLESYNENDESEE
jgi:hypothetical protein